MCVAPPTDNDVTFSQLGFINRGPRPPLGATEQFSGDHGQRPLLNSSAMILQNPVDEQGATSVDSISKGATNHEMLIIIVLDRAMKGKSQKRIER